MQTHQISPKNSCKHSKTNWHQFQKSFSVKEWIQLCVYSLMLRIAKAHRCHPGELDAKGTSWNYGSGSLEMKFRL
jgi:hypothetical protein